MFQGPKGYIVQICEVHLQYGNSTKNGCFTLFSSKFPSNIYSILFDYFILVFISILYPPRLFNINLIVDV